MSIRYKMLGIPVNIDEAVDRAQANNEVPEVYVKVLNLGTLVPGARRFECRVRIRTGRTSFLYQKWERAFDGGYLQLTLDEELQITAKRVADQLYQRGIEVLCNGEKYPLHGGSQPQD